MKHLRQYISQLLTEGIKTQRLHHSREGGRIEPRVYRQLSAEEQVAPQKPDGIWYDCGGVWEDFCNVELGSYSNRGYETVFEVFLNEGNILFISNRVTHLRSEQIALKQSVLMRTAHVLLFPDNKVFQQTLEQYSYMILINPQALVWGLVSGFLIASFFDLLFYLITFLLRFKKNHKEELNT